MLFHLTPAALPEGYAEALVPLADVKAHLRVDTDEEDALIAAMRDAGVDVVERYANLSMGPRTALAAVFDGFGPIMRIGIGPLATLSVTGVAYIDSDGSSVDLTSSDWRIDAGGGLIPAIGARWPATYGPVTVTYSVGFASGACPSALIAATKMFAAHLYLNREAVVQSGMAAEIPMGVTMLCDRYRVPVV
ncbi:MAG: hypothetical protein CMN73_04330 [Sphingomonas sp.]|nr:hypothetical protein [Sphingomonas sp.]